MFFSQQFPPNMLGGSQNIGSILLTHLYQMKFLKIAETQCGKGFQKRLKFVKENCGT